MLGALALASELLIRRQIEPTHTYTRYLSLFRHSTSPDAAFGSSVTVGAFTGQPGFVNLALGGEPIRYILAKIRLYYADKAPGRVIIQASFAEFSETFWRTRNDGSDAEFERMINADQGNSLRILNPMHRASLLGYWKSLVTTGDFQSKVDFMPDGARLDYVRHSDRPERERRMAARQMAQSLRPADDLGGSVAAGTFAEAIDLIRARGGRVCLVTFPTSRAMREEMARHPSYAAVAPFLSELAARHGARYVNLSDLDMPDEDFNDDIHINGHGARKVSPEVVSRCFGDERR